jgi:putative Ca2+/H+ antiporter (TMEM165/GDT1 family)
MPSLELSPVSVPPPILVDADPPLNSAIDRPEGSGPPSGPSNWGFLSVLGSTFITIFLAELGDKTQFATLLMAAQSHNPGVVFVGAAVALIATSLMGVLIGRWLCQHLSPPTLERATAIIMLVIAGGLIVDVIQM